MADALNEAPDALEAKPKSLYAWFALALSSEKAAEHGDLAANDFADRRRYLRDLSSVID